MADSFTTMVQRVVLASASPRRSDLLRLVNVPFLVAAADIDESEFPGEDPLAYVRRVAAGKAAVFVASPGDLVIAADTTVDVDGAILAKPEDAADVRRMLGLISGRTHAVHTAIAVRFGDRVLADVETTLVTVRPITEADMQWYLATGEPFGKAGAYALQGAGGLFVTSVTGSVTNVIGLSLTLLDRLTLEAAGIGLASLSRASPTQRS